MEKLISGGSRYIIIGTVFIIIFTRSLLAKDSVNNLLEYDAIVIGAGISGLTAGQQLQMAGKNILILEGRNRTGGRTYTKNAGTAFPCDVGANWIHNYDATKNPIMNLATSYGLHLSKFDWTNNPSYDEKGSAVSASIMTTGNAKITKLKKDASTYADNLDNDISLGAALQAVIQAQSLSFNSYEKAMLYASLQDEYATESSNLGAWWYDADGPWVDTDGVIVEGYGALADQLAKGLPISLNQKVVGIDYSSPIGSSITVSTAAGVRYSAQQVLVTVPLGVLKKGIISFNPPLPSAMTSAMNLLGVGVLNHIFLRFPSGSLKALQPSLSQVDSFSKLPSDSSLNGHGYVEMISMYHLRQQDILFAEASGSFAVAMEAKNNSKIVAEVMKELRLVYPTLPKPINYTVTRWNQDPFAFGSYSYLGVGATGYGAKSPTTLETLAIGINNNRVFFAGEHTSNAYPSTVQGAHASGLSAAAKMLAVAPSRSPTAPPRSSNPTTTPLTTTTSKPTALPTACNPTISPTSTPRSPTTLPTTTIPTTTSRIPTGKPTTTSSPTALPTATISPTSTLRSPTNLPTTITPTASRCPTGKPTTTSLPTAIPTTTTPTASRSPTGKPTTTSLPTAIPTTTTPTASRSPTGKPTTTLNPTTLPTACNPPTVSPTSTPRSPTTLPTTTTPTATRIPTGKPTTTSNPTSPSGSVKPSTTTSSAAPPATSSKPSTTTAKPSVLVAKELLYMAMK